MVDRIDVITLFPEMILDACAYGVTGRAIEQGFDDTQLLEPAR